MSVVKLTVPNTIHEFKTLSWWAASTSGTDVIELIDEESGHRPVFGIRTGAAPVVFSFSKQSVTASVRAVDAVVGTDYGPDRIVEIELQIPKSLAPEKVIAAASVAYKKRFGAPGIEIFYTRKTDETVRWKYFGTIPKRPIASVRLESGVETELLADAKLFLANEASYKSFGRPYKRVYCLHGPPGTGKTSLVTAIASELDRPLAIFNVDSLRDDTFLELLSDLPQGVALLFEDVDALFKSREGGSLTFSTLLNSLDGVLHPRGSLVFMTTNHLDRLDPALRRPGRVDRMISVPLARSGQVADMWKVAFPKGPGLPRELAAAADKGPTGVSPALTSEVLCATRGQGPVASAAALVSAWKRGSAP